MQCLHSIQKIGNTFLHLVITTLQWPLKNWSFNLLTPSHRVFKNSYRITKKFLHNLIRILKSLWLKAYKENKINNMILRAPCRSSIILWKESYCFLWCINLRYITFPHTWANHENKTIYQHLLSPPPSISLSHLCFPPPSPLPRVSSPPSSLPSFLEASICGARQQRVELIEALGLKGENLESTGKLTWSA